MSSRHASWALAAAVALVVSSAAEAATSTRTSLSPMAGNGHNVSFDGRLFVVRRGPDDASGGWFATVLRPERVASHPDGFPDLSQGAFSDFALVQPFAAGENALALCEADATRAPYRCDDAGNATASGAYDCYEHWVLDSNAYEGEYNGLRRRRLTVWVSSPGTADAAVHHWQWHGDRELLRAGGVDLRGIEPTVTKDGKLLVWQGHPDNDGRIDILMYATNDTACGAGGWDGPHDLAHMVNDPRVVGRYPLAERQLRAADGTAFRDAWTMGGFEIRAADSFHGAYPWLFPDGEALIFTSVVVPCRAANDPVGCGARRGGLSVIGYPTNWALAHIDGAVNPSTDDEVRLFFSSPGPAAFPTLPVTEGLDVWPFFGSNTQNYAEIVFDDGLDGRYAGIWHLNESVTRDGDLDRTKTPDTSGYFNTGLVHGAVFPATNTGPRGKVLEFNGSDAYVEVPHSVSLNPVNGITVEMTLRPAAPVDCDGNNNYRLLLGKGNIGDGAYTLILEENGQLHARVKVGGEQRSLVSSSSIPAGEWSEVAFAYRASTGQMTFVVNGQPAGEATFAPGPLDGSPHRLTLGGPGTPRAACPNGDGAFFGAIEEVRISNTDRLSPEPPPPVEPDAGPSVEDAGGAAEDAGGDLEDSGAAGGDDGGAPYEDAGPQGPLPSGDAGSSPSPVDAGSEPAPVDAGPSEETPGGCACVAPRVTALPSGFALLGALALIARRRRR